MRRPGASHRAVHQGDLHVSCQYEHVFWAGFRTRVLKGLIAASCVMEEIERLEQLSLVSKVCTELENHLGINDKDLGKRVVGYL